jgi:hypothetical protein
MIFALLRGTRQEVMLAGVFDNNENVIVLLEDTYMPINVRHLEFPQTFSECMYLAEQQAKEAFQYYNPDDIKAFNHADACMRLSRFMLQRARAASEQEKFLKAVEA